MRPLGRCRAAAGDGDAGTSFSVTAAPATSCGRSRSASGAWPGCPESTAPSTTDPTHWARQTYAPELPRQLAATVFAALAITGVALAAVLTAAADAPAPHPATARS